MIVTTIGKLKIEAVARNQTTDAHGVGGHKDDTGMATTKEKLKATAANVATAASRGDAAALSPGDEAAAAVTAAVVNPALEASMAGAAKRAAATAAAKHAAAIRPARAANIKAVASNTAAIAAVIAKIDETTSRIATKGTAVTSVATDKATTKGSVATAAVMTNHHAARASRRKDTTIRQASARVSHMTNVDEVTITIGATSGAADLATAKENRATGLVTIAVFIATKMIGAVAGNLATAVAAMAAARAIGPGSRAIAAANNGVIGAVVTVTATPATG